MCYKAYILYEKGGQSLETLVGKKMWFLSFYSTKYDTHTHTS